MRVLTLSLLILVALTACESGTSEYFVVEVTDEVALDYSSSAPGVLRVGAGEAMHILCGEALEQPAELSIDHGFGCLADELRGEAAERSVWVEPAPEEWDLDALCALPNPDPIWAGITIPDDVSLGTAPTSVVDPSWDQVSAEGTWRRDASPCGGNLRVEFTL